MKESYFEGLASHEGPESCADARKDVGEALTGVRAGRDIEPRNQAFQDADAVMLSGRQHGAWRYRKPSAGPARSKTPGTHGISTRENREIPMPPITCEMTGRGRKALCRTLPMHGTGKSDSFVIPAKSLNTSRKAAEAMEGRKLTKANTGEQNAPRTQSRTRANNALDRVRQIAAEDRKQQFTALMHHVTVDLLREAFASLSRRAAPGVDGVTWSSYAENLDKNIVALHSRVQSGRYQAKPSRRTHIPKPDGRLRPLGIAALEDKVVQGAVVVVMNAIYEVDFKGFSYGFRPGRHPHQALDALATGLLRKKINWVLDADVSGFFDHLSHHHLRRFVRHRIKDGRLLRLIDKWLKAGVLERDVRIVAREGTPQGATVSPILANIYLHYVLDTWMQWWRTNQAYGDIIVVRYADDFVIGFQRQSDAQRCLHALADRFRKFGLTLHPTKTRLLRFGRFARAQNCQRGQRRSPQTFDFLGFTHVCGVSTINKFMLVRHTMQQRMASKLKSLKVEMMKRRHQPIAAQGRWLESVVRGHYAYYGVPTNSRRIDAFRTEVTNHWRRALQRRSQRYRLPWSRMQKLAKRWLPYARMKHPWPEQRFDANSQGRSPVR